MSPEDTDRAIDAALALHGPGMDTLATVIREFVE